MERVEVTRIFYGSCHMQVCAVEDATDDEILTVCNRDNPSGTSNGWLLVLRHVSPDDPRLQQSGPVPCQEHDGRIHILVSC